MQQIHAPPAKTGALRIVNLNTWMGHLPSSPMTYVRIEPRGHKKNRLETMLHHLSLLDPDVITLQECLPLPSFAKKIARALDYDAVWRVNNGGIRLFGMGFPTKMGRGEGIAILAKRHLGMKKAGIKRLSGLGWVTTWMAFQLGPQRRAIAVLLHIEGRPFIVVNTHISYAYPSKRSFRTGWAELHKRKVVKHPVPPWWLVTLDRQSHAVRDRELRRLGLWLEYLHTRYNAPILLGGDFNLDPDTTPLIKFRNETGYQEVISDYAPDLLTWEPSTNANIAYDLSYKWPNGRPKHAILQLIAWLDTIPQRPDYIFAHPDLTPTAAGRCFDQPYQGVLASDHYGLWADFNL